jgi:hypothetical protein
VEFSKQRVEALGPLEGVAESTKRKRNILAAPFIDDVNEVAQDAEPIERQIAMG